MDLNKLLEIKEGSNIELKKLKIKFLNLFGKLIPLLLILMAVLSYLELMKRVRKLQA